MLDATDQLSREKLLKKGRITMGSTDSATSRKKEMKPGKSRLCFYVVTTER